MASKGPRPKLDHEPRPKRHKALEVANEPRRPKAHWDHVLEEMIWLSKDFESERKWKLAQAKKVALRASKGMLDQATRGEKKMKEEEQRMKKVALNISKDVKKFWLKIEKLVLYKHQMELDEKKKKALDKQLEFLLGQTERYSTMLAENLADKPVQQCSTQDQLSIEGTAVGENDISKSAELNVEHQSDTADGDDDYNMQSDDGSGDDENTIEEDEALFTKEERREELAALQNEVDVPLEELLKQYARKKVNTESSQEKDEDDVAEMTSSGEDDGISPEKGEDDTEMTSVGKDHSMSSEKGEDGAEVMSVGEDHDMCHKMGEVGAEMTSLSEDHGEQNYLLIASKTDRSSPDVFTGRRCVGSNGVTISETHSSEIKIGEAKNISEASLQSAKGNMPYDFDDEHEDGDFILAAGEEKDDETTILEEEELAKADTNHPMDEIALLQKESEIPLEELLARYKKDLSGDEVADGESEYGSALSEGFTDSPSLEDSELKQHVSINEDVDSGEHQPALDSPTEEHRASEGGSDSENRIEDAAAAARSAQPTGNTFSTTKVRTKFPFLLKFPLREYQHIGLDWLVTMYEKRLNGILADEMGLGKTIMTIALLAHLACEKGIWGPHLIVVPTSVMLNWETEFLKWCPAFKILTYFGSAKERKLKRQGWLKPNSFHVCITTYRLVIQDSKVFKRKKWKYLILDEAHLIKNWKSQRWQTLLNFNSKRRILLTGTPLQNDLMELWSLMHFLMPHIFQSHQEFKDWFSNPISGMVEGQEKVNKEVLDRLHNVLRPFILRRLKRDVEKQLPMKHEHVIYCRLSRRQRNLYEDFIASSETQATLASTNFFGMISIIMQLRKVCNHPDLFEGRPIVSSFDMNGIYMQLSSSICSMLSPGPFSVVDLKGLGFLFTHLDFSMSSWESDEVKALATPSSLIKERVTRIHLEDIGGFKHRKHHKKMHGMNIFEDIQKALMEERLRQAKEHAAAVAWWNSLRSDRKPIYSTSLRDLVTVRHPVVDIAHHKANPVSYMYSSKLADIVLSPVERFQKTIDLVESFVFAIPAARAAPPVCWCSKSESSVFLQPTYKQKCSEVLSPLLSPFRPAIVRRQVYFPDRRLIQFDCGKLQQLAVLLRKLKSEGHRALIFTQMTKMLDVLEAFINLYGYTYMRLDGSTPPEERQTLMQRFNTNPKFFLFILSTRSGGVGINLVGADTVIFYDSDWNPAMDQQAQDRCHRIGQTREVHIYRLISESTIEENILKKANQKRTLDNLVIQSGDYNTEFFKKLDPMELFSGHRALPIKNMQKEKNHNTTEVSLSNVDLEAALKHAEDEADYMALKKVEQEEAVDNQEFTEEAIVRLEDDELVNEDDMKVDEPTDQGALMMMSSNKDSGMMLNGSDPNEERALTGACREDDVDMMADVKQMAAAAAGQEISSFGNQLRPIDHYAIRFLELWDPIIDKTAAESQVRFEEREWELDRIEKYKEEMEAEIDEDEEPLVYETWDAEFATEAYRQQVEALTQHQLMEELEYEAKEKEDEADENLDSLRYGMPSDPKPKHKKKSKKAKFKSLKKRSLASELEPVKGELQVEPMFIDEDYLSNDVFSYSDIESPHSSVQKKRKKAESKPAGEDKISKKKSKKLKKSHLEISTSEFDTSVSSVQHVEASELKPCESVVEFEHKPISRTKMGGKISITAMPVKRVLMIKPEKLKKGNIWSRDCIPSPDFWLSQEDAILCAVVHEYGPYWSLVSETLYGMTAGGFYRGRYRHPIHCCERFRELIQRYVFSAPDNPNYEKVNNIGSGKALLRVTEENIRMLLNVAAEQPNTEYLIQKHFIALLSSVWKMASHKDGRQNLPSSGNGVYFGRNFFSSSNQISRTSVKENTGTMKFTHFGQGARLVAAALNDASSRRGDECVISPNPRKKSSTDAEQLDITLEFQAQKDDSTDPFPSVINLSISDIGPPSENKATEPYLLRDSCNDYCKSTSDANVAENRFRNATRACDEDTMGWASSTFPTYDVRSRSVSKLPSSGKHKLVFSDPVRPSKSKFRKNAVEHGEMRHFLAEHVFPPLPIAAPLNPSPRFDLNLPVNEDIETGDMESTSHSQVVEPSFEESFGVLPHEYVPELLSGLDDCSLLPEYDDIA
ncbi:putative DNA helicase chromatin remodeling SNF2 family [Rosa chinensis]|uniref:DNA helicase n=2 Tax=Rosa chinensis TaxID=74649 RepID=A0A2P6Q8L7_ROSCH|nr:protein PHOTOPERIOD-INDEPENDENT EARLY FLOWERING 1 isoform X1 [Rosa chinensis]PRQ30525.1 putative DNA helicase chromatin remodeling SNF2 family [Rosa chinensis]